MTTTGPTSDQPTGPTQSTKPTTAELTDAERISASLALLWGTQERTARGPKRGLTLDQIVSTALTIADTDGLDALSMRRVARELRVGTMTLYRYLPGKAVLLDLMLDAVSDPAKDIAQCQGKDWRGVLEVVAHSSRRRYLAHPWLLQVNWSRPVVGPNTLAGLEFVVSTLAGLGLTDQERFSVMISIDGLVVGVTRAQLHHEAAVAASGVTDAEFWNRHLPVLSKAMLSGEYPAMAALSEDAYGLGWDETFEWGLQRVLDGIQALIESRRQPADQPPEPASQPPRPA
ncbi:MAG TPA: TetR/AcrR family transcriptional regulator [Natronosporangium sp.]